MRYKKNIYFILIILSVLAVNFVMASFTLGEPASNIVTSYGQGEPIKGWVNISFENESTNSLLHGFGKSMNLLSFLKANFVSSTCFPADCQDSYTPSNEASSKVLNMLPGDEKLLGFKINGQVDSVNTLNFDVSIFDSDGGCSIPLKIDVLDDDRMDLEFLDVSSILCILDDPYGCYDDGDYTGEDFLIVDDPYCAVTTIRNGRGFKIGADIEEVTGKGGDVDFIMQVNSGIDSETCVASATGSGSIDCFVNLTNGITEEENVEVCISVNYEDDGKYKIKYETVDPCGRAGDGNYDFPIFIYPLEYSVVEDFTFSQTLINDRDMGIDIASAVSTYIYNKYDNDCDPYCVIPISFHAGETQDLTISNINLIYTVDGSKSDSSIYDITTIKAKVNSYFDKLDLEKTGFLTPYSSGQREFVLKLGESEILREDIQIVSIATITALTPIKTAALVPTDFTAHLSNSQDDLTYIWDFGDESIKEIIDTNVVEHIYPNVGDYSVNVTVSGSFGNVSKTFMVEVVSPEEAIIEILEKYNERAITLRNKINTFPTWVQESLDTYFDIEDVEQDLVSYQDQYERAFNDVSYVNLMKTLLQSEVPYNLTITKKLPPGALFLNKEQLNLETLKDLGAGNIDDSEDYDNLINTWLANSFSQANIESKTYTLFYDGYEEDLVSQLKVVLEPNQNLGDVYFIVNGQPTSIEFLGESSKSIRDRAEVIILPDFSQIKTIEFLYPGTMEIGNFPIYLSPEFKNLQYGIRPGICNFNSICEKGLEENYKNCRNDCKPYMIIFLFLGILFIVFLFIYIVLQEWYKRRYESKLFPNKNQLFNIINFINHSLNQGLRKSDIFSSLKDLDWSGEQLEYAWRKFHGYRTGMWEIPIFKWVENRQVKKELAKRQGIPVQGKSSLQKRMPTRIRKLKHRVNTPVKRPGSRIRRR